MKRKPIRRRLKIEGLEDRRVMATITGGTGRFATTSGTFTVVQTRGLSMPYNNSATIDGTINLGH